ncbi:MAG: VWA domain-containing protein [Bacteroidales bacterium]|nr:VWA domain-containing protein [Bacteroidales bacterium]
MKKTLFFLLLIFSLNIQAQNLTAHKAVVAGLNNYMEFIHQSTHTLYLMQNDLQSFNQDLLHKLLHPNSSLTFDKRDYLNDHLYYFLTPPEIYDISVNTLLPISSVEKDSLNKQLYRLKFLIEMLDITIGFIDTYVKDSLYLTDSSFSKAFSYLNASVLYFDNYLSAWKNMVNLIERIAAKYEVVDLQNPYIKTSVAMDSLFDVVYLISDAARIGDTNSVRLFLPLLENQIDKLEGKAEFYLNGATSYGRSNGKDPFNRYDNIIFDAKAELAHTKSFLKPTLYPNYSEKIYGKDYYFYNQKFINKFNRHGLGMAYEYNSFADNSNHFVLKKAQIPQTFKVLFPPEPIQQVVTQTNTDTLQPYSLAGAPANNLVFLLDVSNSMSHPLKLPLLKDAIKFLISQMRDYDYVTIVTYSGDAQIVVDNISAHYVDSLNFVIDNLKSSGTTNLYKGVKLAYKSANNNYISSGNNRIILATDGDVKINSKIKRISRNNSDKIILSVFYFSQYDNNFDKLSALSKIGKGNCVKITEDNIKTIIINEAKGD